MGKRLMTQADQVLTLLRERRSRGIHSFELRGEYIGNPSQRIEDLRDRGFVIDAKRERLSAERAMGARYTLVSEPEVEQAAGVPQARTAVSQEDGPSPAEPSGALFEVPPVGKPGWADVESAA